MNRCTVLDDILHAHVPRQPRECYWISRSIGHRSRSHVFSVFFCVNDAAVTRRQYLALSKAWWSCHNYFCQCNFWKLVCSQAVQWQFWVSMESNRCKCCWVYAWKNLEGRSISGKDMEKSRKSYFAFILTGRITGLAFCMGSCVENQNILNLFPMSRVTGMLIFST